MSSVFFTPYARKRMERRGITASQVETALQGAALVESYPEDRPYPSRLVLGWVEGRPLHVVLADAPELDVTLVITVYEPDPTRWDETFTNRRPR